MFQSARHSYTFYRRDFSGMARDAGPMNAMSTRMLREKTTDACCELARGSNSAALFRARRLDYALQAGYAKDFDSYRISHMGPSS